MNCLPIEDRLRLLLMVHPIVPVPVHLLLMIHSIVPVLVWLLLFIHSIVPMISRLLLVVRYHTSACPVASCGTLYHTSASLIAFYGTLYRTGFCPVLVRYTVTYQCFSGCFWWYIYSSDACSVNSEDEQRRSNALLLMVHCVLLVKFFEVIFTCEDSLLHDVW